MGWIKDAKAAAVTKDAETAAAAGRRVFACRLNVGSGNAGFSGEVPGWGEMLEAVEATGWTLDRWAVSSDSKGRPEAYLLFRR